jgi:hypothetical protein
VYLVVVAALLAGCSILAVSRLEAGKSSEADVRASLGEPKRVFTNPDGSRQLAFASGPEGTQTFMAYVSPDGRLTRLEQVLTNEHLAKIDRGTMTSAQLERLIGPPWRTVDFPRKQQVAWDYVFRDEWGYKVDYSVMIDRNGVVVDTAYVRRDTGSKDGMR